jgi:hypothetical protein
MDSGMVERIAEPESKHQVDLRSATWAKTSWKLEGGGRRWREK